MHFRIRTAATKSFVEFRHLKVWGSGYLSLYAISCARGAESRGFKAQSLDLKRPTVRTLNVNCDEHSAAEDQLP